jgi:hypothetical protein
MRNHLPLLAAAALFLAGCAGMIGGPSTDLGEGPWSTSDLAAHGRWIDYPPYGNVWTPYDVSEDWRPYGNGTRAQSEYGWTWISNDPWGADPYHYGRWLHDPGLGWVWVPGSVWAPAWVAWRTGGDWIGWAPLPPGSGYRASDGFRGSESRSIPPAAWCFVARRTIDDSNLRAAILPASRNAAIVSRTRDATRYAMRSGRAINAGPDLGVLARSGIRVRRVTPQELGALTTARSARGPAPDVAREEPIGKGIATSPAPLPSSEIGDALQGPARRRYDTDRRALEVSIDRQRAELEKTHARDRKRVPRGSVGAMLNRHAAEDQAFEESAMRQRQALDAQWQKRMAADGASDRKKRARQ